MWHCSKKRLIVAIKTSCGIFLGVRDSYRWHSRVWHRCWICNPMLNQTQSIDCLALIEQRRVLRGLFSDCKGLLLAGPDLRRQASGRWRQCCCQAAPNCPASNLLTVLLRHHSCLRKRHPAPSWSQDVLWHFGRTQTKQMPRCASQDNFLRHSTNSRSQYILQVIVFGNMKSVWRKNRRNSSYLWKDKNGNISLRILWWFNGRFNCSTDPNRWC